MFQVIPLFTELLVAHFTNQLGRIRGGKTVSPVVFESGVKHEAAVAVFATVRPALIALLLVLFQTFPAHKLPPTSFTVGAALIVTGRVFQEGVFAEEALITRAAVEMTACHNVAV